MRTVLQTNKMVVIPASASVVEGFTFTVGQIIWTTRADGLTTMVLEKNQIQSAVVKAVAPVTSTVVTSTPTMSPTMPTTRPLLPRYNGKRIDNSDLLQAIGRADHKLFVAFDLVNLVSGQGTRTAPPNC